MADIIQLRRDTEANWTSYDPVLADGEMAISTDTTPIKLKLGDGVHNWSDLTYFDQYDFDQYVTAAESARDASLLYSAAASNSAGLAAVSQSAAAASATAADNSADIAASFVGGNWPLPHSHVTGPVAVDAEYSRLSDAYDSVGKRYEYNQRIWDSTYGTEIWEGTTNLLPAGAEDFVTGWINGTGETCTVTDYPMYIDGIGDVIAKRITGNGAGPNVYKRYAVITGLTNPHAETVSCWAMLISGNAKIRTNGGAETDITSTMQRVSASSAVVNSVNATLFFRTAAITDILDIVVYAPQIENKPYATSYTPPGTTRAAETFAIPVNAYQKNLLTLNQATGGDTLGDTTGFTGLNGTTISRETAKAWNGTGSIKIVTPGSVQYEGCTPSSFTLTAGKIYTMSGYIRGGTGGESVNFGIAGVGSTANALTTGFGRVSYTFVGTGTSQQPVFSTGTSIQAATFYIDGLQLEEGTTASDFALPAVDYSNAVINPTEFTVEMKLSDGLVEHANNTYRSLFIVQNNTSANFFGIGEFFTNSYRLSTTNSSGAVSTFDFSPPVGAKVIKVRNKEGTITIYADGAIVSGFPITPVNFPSVWDSTYVINICCDTKFPTRAINQRVSNLRVSRIARTDAEMSYTGQLLPDEYTTYYSDLKESISSRPFVKVNGLAQNVVLAGDSPNQNAIVNGDFRLAGRTLPVTDPATGTVIIDGMSFAFNGTGGSKTFSQQTVTNGQQDIPGAVNYLRLVQTAPSGQTTQQYVCKIEDVRTYNGRKVKLILNARCPEQLTLPSIVVTQNFGSGGSTAVTVQTIANVKLLSKINRYKFEFTMPAVAGKTIGVGNHIAITINHPLNAAFTLDIADIELKPADAPNVFYRRDIQMLQQLGARTLQKLPANLTISKAEIQPNYIDFKSTLLPVEMRGVPTFGATYAETTNWKVLVNGVQTTGFTLALLNASANQVAFRATKTSHGLTDATLQLVTNVLLSAEL